MEDVLAPFRSSGDRRDTPVYGSCAHRCDWDVEWCSDHCCCGTVRGSDYIGKGANGIYSLLIEPALKKGKAAWITGHLDMPHTFTVNTDMARALITLASQERAWGRPWHVPSPPAVTIRELARRYAVAADRPPIKLIELPRFVMRTAGLVVPIAREMAEMDYQWYAPFVMDATETADTFA
ncbi:hypothetical protein AB0M80_21815 [Amycolatopsis sp. NPDC051045]|uniref:hypothetical protein n=1 Tax=Amycolatopsis sp. NPDC051045 TaxID=3156922 RepID=UPI00341B1901